MAIIPDPYKALGVPHEASSRQIKLAFRKLALINHPDRLAAQDATPEQRKAAVGKFAEAAAAYQLLSDPRRKREYDHIYKYGGYDDQPQRRRPTPPPPQPPKPPSTDQVRAEPFSPFPRSPSSKERSRGIGYSIKDPISFLFRGGGSGSAAVAGIQIPSGIHLAHPPPGGGFRFAFSSGKCTTTPSGAKQYVSKTTQFVQGKTYSRVETTTVHPDGRKEVVIEGNDYIERRVSSPPKKKQKAQKLQSDEDVAPADEPWYTCAWNGIRDKLNMCHNPCAAVLAQ